MPAKHHFHYNPPAVPRRFPAATLCLASLAGMPAVAGDSREPEQVVVTGTTPVPGLEVDADRFPGNIQSVIPDSTGGNAGGTLTSTLDDRLGSINVNDALADPFQPDIQYRGFAASPVLGTPQGLAVYQNGVRINEAFGDSVNWDLVPDLAVQRVDLVSGTPLYGLNALGGAVALTMKTGFTQQGLEAGLSGGSFQQRAGTLEYGRHGRQLGFYAAARILDQEGWRLHARDEIRQYYAALSVRGDGRALDVGYTHGGNHLAGQGAAPVQSLALSRASVFTGPQANANTLDLLTLNASQDLGAGQAIQGVAYASDFRQLVDNGNRSDYTGCTSATATGLLCQPDGETPLLDAAGAVVPDLTDSGNTAIGQLDYNATHSSAWGASIQFASSRKPMGHGNAFASGITLDVARSTFQSRSTVGVLDASLLVRPSPYVVNTPEGTAYLATPVQLGARNQSLGFYATDTLDVTPRLAVTVSGRYTRATVSLADRRGTALTGTSRFGHFNPAAGATWRWTPALTAYAGYSMNNRAPMPSEIECSDPLQPCLLPSSLAGDPPTLKQVIAHTIEAGVRGRSAASIADARFAWNAGLFRTQLDDDIYGVATSTGTGYFRNIGRTRRQGFEAGVQFKGRRWSASGQYSHVDATFETALTINSASNPYRDAQGNIQVQPGDRLPLIPADRLKASVAYAISPSWNVGVNVSVVGRAWYRGDESNRNPPLPGYAVLAINSSRRFGPHVDLFASIRNLLDARYASYGLLSDPTGVGAPGVPADAAPGDAGLDTRFQSPAMPRAFFGGLRISL